MKDENKYKLVFANLFKKKYKKIVKDIKTKKSFKKVIFLLEKDPFSLALKTHKVVSIATNSLEYSSRVNGDIRIIWNFSEKGVEILNIYNIGGHSGKNKVYK